MSATGATIQVELEGQGACRLGPQNFIAQGGEASIYRYKGFTIKVYTDRAKMARDDMAGKITLLKQLQHPSIFAPRGVALSQGSPIGFYMPWAEGEPLPRVFTTAFWKRESFDAAQASTLVERMRDITRYAHDHQAVMVDANELNWLMHLSRKDGPVPRIIDVDSWAVGQWGAKVIMSSIRDWHTKGFTSHSDWFSWAVVTFQIYTGIHPYRGTLPGYGNTEQDREERMKKNASVFSPGVKLNRAVRDLGDIPGPLREWYTATFQRGERTIPPSPFDKGAAAVAPKAVTSHTTINASGTLMLDKLLERVGDPIIRVWHCGAVLTQSGELVDAASKQRIGTLSDPNGEVVKVDQGWLLADWDAGVPKYTFVDDRTRAAQSLNLSMKAHAFLRYENRLFLVSESELIELDFMHAGRPLLSIGKRTQIFHSQATKWFDGVGVEEALGASFLVLPFGSDACSTVRVKELDSLTPIVATAGNRFASVMALDKSGTYHKLEFAFSADYTRYTLWRGTAADPNLNVAILPKMVCATIVEDGEFVIFVPSNGNMNKVKDRMVTTDMELGNWNDTVVCIKDGALWSIKMKTP